MKQSRKVLILGLVLLSTFAWSSDSEEPQDDSDIEEVVVSARASLEVDRLSKPSFAVLSEESVQITSAVHPSELLNEVPGVWISRGSGQEHLTAIRSGVLTGAGACGAFMLLENGIPVRPSSFCNVNGLFELNTEQASSIEVIRGPASSRYGGNALHGVINVLTLMDEGPNVLRIEGGHFDWRQVQGKYRKDSFSLNALLADSGGWRDDTGYTHQKLNSQFSQDFEDWSVTHTLAYNQLNQETGGYVLGEDAYKDPDLRSSNPNPEAYRDAHAIRWASHISTDDFVWTPYARLSDMNFLMHFLPGQPTEENSHQSLGSLFRWFRTQAARSLEFGVQAEIYNVELKQTQNRPTTGSAFLVATRPSGTHYDFEVKGLHFGAYHDGAFEVNPNLTFSYRLRSEWANYDYVNHHLIGNTKDDGSNCGFGGCLYTRPADRSDRFVDSSAKFTLERALGDQTKLHASIGTSFRPPQLTELYRLQSGQEIAEIDSESLTSSEVGINRTSEANQAQFVVYTSRNKDVVIRDSEGFNQNGGKVRSRGIEFLWRHKLTERQEVSVSGTYAHHQYDVDLPISRGGRITKGNDVDTAPRQLVHGRWLFHFTESLDFNVDVVRIGSYYLDLANSAKYPGHSVINLSTRWQVNETLSLHTHIRNLTDKLYADRADLAFGNLRYFPAMPRTVRVGFTIKD